ncbi:unnamed protein product [Ceutorhynchus assimilis]|uniref:Uncharacterized protein n=1 Tax=Ceutorhynchus assimilis TaxID=467358 RepID=A0A9P0DKP3_9CUCU|nr:unnamed protein product [Ceutorhynchus assimilis]
MEMDESARAVILLLDRTNSQEVTKAEKFQIVEKMKQKTKKLQKRCSISAAAVYREELERGIKKQRNSIVFETVTGSHQISLCSCDNIKAANTEQGNSEAAIAETKAKCTEISINAEKELFQLNDLQEDKIAAQRENYQQLTERSQELNQDLRKESAMPKSPMCIGISGLDCSRETAENLAKKLNDFQNSTKTTQEKIKKLDSIISRYE